MHATGEYTIAELMEVFSIGRATVYHVLDRAGAGPGAGMGRQLTPPDRPCGRRARIRGPGRLPPPALAADIRPRGAVTRRSA
jgi:hypothetical protein